MQQYAGLCAGLGGATKATLFRRSDLTESLNIASTAVEKAERRLAARGLALLTNRPDSKGR